MNLNSVHPKFRIILMGMFVRAIAYAMRWLPGNYEQFWGKWENQKKFGLDYNVCWTYAGDEKAESEIQMLLSQNLVPQEIVDWLKLNRYIDKDGDVFLSRRWIATLSGSTFNGNDEAVHWELAEEFGLIPDAMFPFREDQSGAEYFDKRFITQEMRDMGQEFLKRFRIEHEELGGENARFSRRSLDMIRTALKQAPLQIGIPVPKEIWRWNSAYIKWDGSTVAAHSVELSGITDKGEYIIYDQYNPCRKLLSPDYYIPIITRSIITPIVPGAPIIEKKKTLGDLIWIAIAKYLGFNVIDPQVAS